MTWMIRSLLVVCLLFLLLCISHGVVAQSAPAWQPWTSYSTGQLVTFGGVTYKCIQAHTSEPGWEPPNVPALWQPVSTTSVCAAAPSVPTGLTASGTGSSSTTLNWSASSAGANCSVTSYTVFQNGVAIATVSSGTSYTASGLSPSTTYNFAVAATDSAGASSPSSAVSVTTTASSCSTSPSAPTGLAASGTTSSATTLNWSAASVSSNCTVMKYTIYENGSAIATVSGSTSFTVSGLSPSTNYSFTVAATDASGTSSQSGAVSVTTAASSSGSGCASTWNATAVYTAGMKANVNGINYVANWWTQGQNPATNSGPSGSGQPWTSLGACSSCTTVPSTPAGLSVSGTTSSSTTLNWSGATVASNCTLSGYTIFANGAAVGTSSGTNFTVNGLAASTAYNFTVSGKDEAGSSPQSGSVSVTTLACTGTCTKPGTNLFAPYIDMSLTPDEQILTIQQQSGIKAFTLAFLTAGGCSTGWGGLGGTLPQDSLPNGTTVQSLVQQLQASGVQIIISFGGANGQDPAAFCTDAGSLQAVYQSVINRYNVKMLDFDIEGGAVSNQTAITLRDQALKGLKAANPGLVISYTLPVLPTGLVQSGVNILNSIRVDGLTVDVINVMAMDYGSAVDNGGQMGLDATQAASNTFNQIQAAGLNSKVGVTPMIGVNDTNTEIFQLIDAQTLLNFAHSNSYITRLAMWSVARDNGSCAGAGFASPVCSSISQANYAFSQIFEGF